MGRGRSAREQTQGETKRKGGSPHQRHLTSGGSRWRQQPALGHKSFMERPTRQAGAADTSSHRRDRREGARQERDAQSERKEEEKAHATRRGEERRRANRQQQARGRQQREALTHLRRQELSGPRGPPAGATCHRAGWGGHHHRWYTSARSPCPASATVGQAPRMPLPHTRTLPAAAPGSNKAGMQRQAAHARARPQGDARGKRRWLGQRR